MHIVPVKFSNLSFSSNIIDAHSHVGTLPWTQPSPTYFGPQKIKEAQNSAQPMNTHTQDPDKVVKSLISSLDCMTDNAKSEIEENEEVLAMCKKDPFFAPVAVCRPGEKDGDANNIKDLLNNHPGKFVALKFHPEALELNANDEKYDAYLDVAQEYNLPCIFHCDCIGSVSEPQKIYELAKRHPNVAVIMAHMGAGGGENHDRAIDVLKESIEKKDANLYADISWVDWQNDLSSEYKPHLIRVINELSDTSQGDKTDRLLFGSDTPLGCFGENQRGEGPAQNYAKTIRDIKSSIKNNFDEQRADELIEKILFKNADNLFFDGQLSKQQKVCSKLDLNA